MFQIAIWLDKRLIGAMPYWSYREIRLQLGLCRTCIHKCSFECLVIANIMATFVDICILRIPHRLLKPNLPS